MDHKELKPGMLVKVNSASTLWSSSSPEVGPEKIYNNWSGVAARGQAKAHRKPKGIFLYLGSDKFRSERQCNSDQDPIMIKYHKFLSDKGSIYYMYEFTVGITNVLDYFSIVQ